MHLNGNIARSCIHVLLRVRAPPLASWRPTSRCAEMLSRTFTNNGELQETRWSVRLPQ
jgi:hypothetical protein